MARLILAICAILGVFGAAPLRADAQALRMAEAEIKAGLIYSFLRYTDWTTAIAPNARIVVCVYGNDPFGGVLAPIVNRSVNGRTIDLRTVRADADLAPCALLFVSSRDRAQWPRLHAALANRRVLTVSDSPGFCDANGMIEFVDVDAHIGIRVNRGAISAAGLSVEDRLLRLAQTSGGRS